MRSIKLVFSLFTVLLIISCISKDPYENVKYVIDISYVMSNNVTNDFQIETNIYKKDIVNKYYSTNITEINPEIMREDKSYNSNGDLISKRQIIFDNETKWQYIYDNNHKIKYESCYESGIEYKTNNYIYIYNNDGQVIEIKRTNYIGPMNEEMSSTIRIIYKYYDDKKKKSETIYDSHGKITVYEKKYLY